MPTSSSFPSQLDRRDLNRELLLGTLASYTYVLNDAPYLRSLPRHIDDAERDFGLDIYERMSHDPALAAALAAITVLVVRDGYRLLCPVSPPSAYNPDPEQEARYERAEAIRRDVAAMLDRLQQPLIEIIEELLDCLAFGHAIAEQTYEQRSGLLALRTLRVRPRTAYAFVVDQFMNVLGVVPRPELGIGVPVDPSQIVPREKFVLLTWGSRYGDPRGRSLLRPAYNAWWLKQQTWPHYLKFLLQFGTPSVAGKLPEGATDVELFDTATGEPRRDANGNPVVVSAADALLEKLIAWSNGTAIALDHGTELQLIESRGDGEAYVNAIDLYDRQMTRAVLIAIRATMEAEHGSRADSETAQDMVSAFAQLVRRRVEVALYRDCIMPLVRYNWGDDAADELCPYITLSDVAPEDVVAVGNMIANLARQPGLIHPSQYPGIDQKLGLPERDFASQMAEMDAANQRAQEIAHNAFGVGVLPGD